jgi:hypothetical protein
MIEKIQKPSNTVLIFINNLLAKLTFRYVIQCPLALCMAPLFASEFVFVEIYVSFHQNQPATLNWEATTRLQVTLTWVPTCLCIAVFPHDTDFPYAAPLSVYMSCYFEYKSHNLHIFPCWKTEERLQFQECASL